MIRLIVALLLLLVMAGCTNVDPVDAEAIEAVAETCKAKGQEVYVFQTAAALRIECR